MSLTAAKPRLRLSSVSRTHSGRRRPVNEDRLLDRAEIGLWAVADGMGGHSLGDVAASRVIEALSDLDGAGSGYGRLVDAEHALQAVNTRLLADNQISETSGATLVMLLAHEDHLACVWAGDSRTYQLRDGVLTRITRDHSVVQALVDAGEISEAERHGHPSAHLVTRAVGVSEALELDRYFAPIQQGDRFLLCSDGLTACLEDHELEGLLSGELDIVADALLNLALERGAPDNVSFVVIRADLIAQ
jgi:serine/threonine protein phosphatase PrpC